LKKKIITSLIVLVILIIIIVIVFSDTDEARIRKKLDFLAETVSKDRDDGMYTALSKVEDLNETLTEDCSIRLKERFASIRGRANLTSTFSSGFQYVSELDVSFSNVTVEIHEEEQTAKTSLTATATSPDLEKPEVRKVEISLKKIEGEWWIYAVNEVTP
jgi:hypothetical protein